MEKNLKNLKWIENPTMKDKIEFKQMIATMEENLKNLKWIENPTMKDKIEFKQMIRSIFKRVKEYQNLKVGSMTFSVYLLDISFIEAFEKFLNGGKYPGPFIFADLKNPNAFIISQEDCLTIMKLMLFLGHKDYYTKDLFVPKASKIEAKCFICQHCKLQRSSRQALENHISSAHDQNVEKELLCPYCPKKSYVHDTHKKHLATHVGVQPICILCQKKFSHKSNLNAHFKICQTKTPEQRNKSKKNKSGRPKMFRSPVTTNSSTLLPKQPTINTRNNYESKKENLKTNVGKVSLTCCYCEKIFDSCKTLIDHCMECNKNPQLNAMKDKITELENHNKLLLSKVPIIDRKEFEKHNETIIAKLEEETKDTPKNGTTKILKNNGKSKKLKISREIKCPACKAVFPTEESMSLHTCTSILDGHISEEGKERQKISTVSQNLTKVEFKI